MRTPQGVPQDSITGFFMIEYYIQVLRKVGTVTLQYRTVVGWWHDHHNQ